MTTQQFPPDRMQPSVYLDVEDSMVTSKLVGLVGEYMHYLRQDPTTIQGWDLQKEIRTAENFVMIINRDEAWPLVRPMVQEFKQPPPSEEERRRLPAPLAYVLHCVAPRLPLPRPPPRLTQVAHWEEKLLRKRLTAQLRYCMECVGSLEVDSDNTEEWDFDRMNEGLNMVIRVKPAPEPDVVPATARDGGEKTQEAKEEEESEQSITPK